MEVLIETVVHGNCSVAGCCDGRYNVATSLKRNGSHGYGRVVKFGETETYLFDGKEGEADGGHSLESEHHRDEGGVTSVFLHHRLLLPVFAQERLCEVFAFLGVGVLVLRHVVSWRGARLISVLIHCVCFL